MTDTRNFLVGKYTLLINSNHTFIFEGDNLILRFGRHRTAVKDNLDLIVLENLIDKYVSSIDKYRNLIMLKDYLYEN
jgi:hypothetical protein